MGEGVKWKMEEFSLDYRILTQEIYLKLVIDSLNSQ